MNFVKFSTFWPYSRNAKSEFPKKKPGNFKQAIYRNIDVVKMGN